MAAGTSNIYEFDANDIQFNMNETPYTRVKLNTKQKVIQWLVIIALNVIGLPILGVAFKIAWYLLKFGFDLV